jgi:hypothetical protein
MHHHRESFHVPSVRDGCSLTTEPLKHHQLYTPNTATPTSHHPPTASYKHPTSACYHRPCRHPRHRNPPAHSPIRPAAATLSLPAATLAIATHLATVRRDRVNCKRRTEAAHRHRNARPHICRRSGGLLVRARPNSPGFRAREAQRGDRQRMDRGFRIDWTNVRTECHS